VGGICGDVGEICKQHCANAGSSRQVSEDSGRDGREAAVHFDGYRWGNDDAADATFNQRNADIDDPVDQ